MGFLGRGRRKGVLINMAAVQQGRTTTGAVTAAPSAAAAAAAATVSSATAYKPSILQQLALSGSACAISTFFTNPIDMMKCRLQLQVTSGDAREYKGMFRGEEEERK